MKKIKSITNINTVGELRKFLSGLPDDIKLRTSDSDSSYSEPISMTYYPHLRTFMIDDVEYSDFYINGNSVDVEITSKTS